jgi:hypothetical protein
VAKEPEPKKPWTPADPLEDQDDEEEVQAKARAKARLDYLTGEYNKPPEKKKKKFSLLD